MSDKLCFVVDDVTGTDVSISVYADALPMTLRLSVDTKSGETIISDVDMSCLSDMMDSKIPTNHVTVDTNQEITGEKTFVGQKKIAFKQSAAADKLGFTLFDLNNNEVGYLEYNPSASGKVNNTPVMTLGNYATKAAERSYVGFRRYSSISGASGAYNLLTPLIVDARTPFNLTTTYTNFYLLLGVSDGTNMYTVGSNGVLDLSAMIPTGLVHINGAETINGVKTFNAGYFGNVEVLTGSTIDVSHATAFTKTISANTTFTFSGVPTGRSACFSLKLEDGGDYTVTWPSSVHWCNDTEPELTSGGTDILTFMTFDGGTNWYGTLSMTGITQ